MYPLGGTGGSPEGVLDMAGNVWEWCLNKYDNPDDTSDGGEDARVWRGGSWGHSRGYARASVRNLNHPNLRRYGLGFRLCCEYPHHLSHRSLGSGH